MNGNWIDVTERLPEFGQYVLIMTTQQVDGEGQMSVSRLEECQVYGNDRVPWKWLGPGPFSFFAWEVTHWTPLPDPPEAKAE